jgi:hypothetical protein
MRVKYKRILYTTFGGFMHSSTCHLFKVSFQLKTELHDFVFDLGQYFSLWFSTHSSYTQPTIRCAEEMFLAKTESRINSS